MLSNLIEGGKNILVFSAHAADFCSRSGGTISRLVDVGSTVHVVDFSFGEICESPALWSQTPKLSIEQIKEIRATEIENAARVLGVSIECLDFGDCPLVIGSERQKQLLELFRHRQPDIVLTHWKNDILHPDHCVATEAVIWASRYCFRPGVEGDSRPCSAPQVIFYETTLGTAPLAEYIPTLYVDIGASFKKKCKALECFHAQPGLAERYGILAKYRALEAQSTAWMKGCEYAEAFIPLNTQAAGFSRELEFGG